MKSKRINQLLDKFYEGSSTLEEEGELSRLLKDSDEENIQLERKLFNYFDEGTSDKLPDDFEERLEDKLWGTPEKETKTVNWRTRLAVAASVCVLIAATLVFYMMDNTPVEWVVYKATDQPTSVELPDGSQVWINKNSEIRVQEQFGDVREVWLSGEAFFEVVKDPAREFLVYTGETITKVHGTSFNIREYTSEGTVELSVVTGKVSFYRQALPKKAMVLTANQHAVYSIAGNDLASREVISKNTIAWKTKTLRFDDELMLRVLDDLEQYYDLEISVSNTEILNCHFKGEFEQPNLEQILDIMAFSMDLKVEQTDTGYLLAGAGCEPEIQ